MTQPLEIGRTALRSLDRTVAVDGQGRPLVLHHGTNMRFDRFGRTKDLGTHFGSLAQAERRLDALEGEKDRPKTGLRRIVSAAVRVLNPIFVPDDPISWNAPFLMTLFRRFFTDTEVRSLLDCDGQPKHDTMLAAVRAKLAGEGYDGVVYRNVIESPTRARALDWSWCVFHPDDIVVLGENVAAKSVAVPAGSGFTPGRMDLPTDPRTIPGLRRRNGYIVYQSERRRFVSEAAEALRGAGAEDIEGAPGRAWRRGDLGRPRLGVPLPDGTRIIAEICPDLGRIYLSPDAENRYAALAGLDLCDDGGPVRRLVSPCALSFEWMPGENVTDVMRRVVDGVTAWRDLVAPAAPSP